MLEVGYGVHSFEYECICVILICNYNSNVGNEDAILLIEMESDDEGILFTIFIKFVKLNVYILTFIFQYR